MCRKATPLTAEEILLLVAALSAHERAGFLRLLSAPTPANEAYAARAPWTDVDVRSRVLVLRELRFISYRGKN